MTKLPKYLTSHPGVKFADTGDNQGSDYRWYVEFKDGWCPSNGRNEGGGSLFFNSREDFIGHGVVQVETYRKLCRLQGREPQQRGEV
jgi:hypothetical protein